MFIKRYEEFSLLKRYDFIYERSENNHFTFYAYFTKKRVGEKTKGVPLYSGRVPKTFQRNLLLFDLLSEVFGIPKEHEQLQVSNHILSGSWKRREELEENRYSELYVAKSFSA